MQNSQMPGTQGLAIPEGCERSQGEPCSPRAPAAMHTCSANRNKAHIFGREEQMEKMHMGEGWTGGQAELRKQMRLRVKKTD